MKQVTIQEVDNGFVVTVEEDDGDGLNEGSVKVYTDIKEVTDELEEIFK